MQTRQKLFRPAEPEAPAGGEILPLNQRPEYQEPLKELQALEALHAEKERERNILVRLARGEKIKRTATERAQALLAGGRIDPVTIPDKLAALDTELGILRDAISAKTRELDHIAGEIAFAESIRARPMYLNAMNEMYAHLRAAFSDYQRAVAVAGKLNNAGLRPSSAIFPDLMPPSLRGVQLYELQTMRRELDALEESR